MNTTTVTKADIVAGLTKIQNLFRNRWRWIRGCAARVGRKGAMVGASNPNATCFCLTGAASKVAPNAAVEGAIDLALATAIATITDADAVGSDYIGDVQAYNDSRTRTIFDIRRVVSTAIRLQKAA